MKNLRKKNEKLLHVSDIINQFLQTYRQNTDEDFVQIWNLWEDIMGKDISKNALPSGFKGRCLHVKVSSSPWMHQLQMLKNDIKDKLNSALGKHLVDEIKFKIGG
jgi:predicted nucleic acid-binding Zn ribbon protein